MCCPQTDGEHWHWEPPRAPRRHPWPFHLRHRCLPCPRPALPSAQSQSSSPSAALRDWPTGRGRAGDTPLGRSRRTGARPCARLEGFTRFMGPAPSSTPRPALAPTGSGHREEGAGSGGKQHGREERGKSPAGTEPTLLPRGSGRSRAGSLGKPGVPLVVASVSRCRSSQPALPSAPMTLR